jgi:methylmalonyl-CoA/ethylmalonyl-CoA epimerase
MIFHHLGVACDSVAVEAGRFEALGYRCEGPVFRDSIQRVEGTFMTGPGPRLELLAPLDASSPVSSWLEKGVKYYHQGFEILSMTDALKELVAQRGVVVASPEPSIAFGGRSIAFVMLPGMILIELIEMEATA